VNNISDFERLALASNNPFISKDNPAFHYLHTPTVVTPPVTGGHTRGPSASLHRKPILKRRWL